MQPRNVFLLIIHITQLMYGRGRPFGNVQGGSTAFSNVPNNVSTIIHIGVISRGFSAVLYNKISGVHTAPSISRSVGKVSMQGRSFNAVLTLPPN